MNESTIIKKYEFVENDTVRTSLGAVLRRIRALVAIPEAKVVPGQLGGYLLDENNLSHTGHAWVHDEAWVYDNARVYGNAMLYGDAQVCGRAEVFGDAVISERAWISGRARVYENAKISGMAWVYDSSQVYGKAQVRGVSRVFDTAQVLGAAQVYGTAEICGRTRVSGDTKKNRPNNVREQKDAIVAECATAWRTGFDAGVAYGRRIAERCRPTPPEPENPYDA